MHDLLKQTPEVFESTLGHIKKHTLYQYSMMPEDHKNLLDQRLRESKNRIRMIYGK